MKPRVLLRTSLERLKRGVEEITETGCWVWMGAVKENGYARHYARLNDEPRKNWHVHRLTYTLVRGPIPDGCEIDHLCRVRCCVNPAHLEAVPHRINLLRGDGISAKCARKVECLRGHPFTGHNLMKKRKGRGCRACHNEGRRHRARVRAQPGPVIP